MECGAVWRLRIGMGELDGEGLEKLQLAPLTTAW